MAHTNLDFWPWISSLSPLVRQTEYAIITHSILKRPIGCQHCACFCGPLRLSPCFLKLRMCCATPERSDQFFNFELITHKPHLPFVHLIILVHSRAFRGITSCSVFGTKIKLKIAHLRMNSVLFTVITYPCVVTPFSLASGV